MTTTPGPLTLSLYSVWRVEVFYQDGPHDETEWAYWNGVDVEAHNAAIYLSAIPTTRILTEDETAAAVAEFKAKGSLSFTETLPILARFEYDPATFEISSGEVGLDGTDTDGRPVRIKVGPPTTIDNTDQGYDHDRAWLPVHRCDPYP